MEEKGGHGANLADGGDTSVEFAGGGPATLPAMARAKRSGQFFSEVRGAAVLKHGILEEYLSLFAEAVGS